MNDLVCPNCSKDTAGYAGNVKVVPVFDGALRSYNYKDVSVDLEYDTYYFPSEIFNSNPSTVIDYFPNITVEITCPFCEESFSVDVKNEDADDLKQVDRGIGGSEKLELFGDKNLYGKAGKHGFEELHIESDGEYRGVTTFNFSNIGTTDDLKRVMEDASTEGFKWFQSEDDPELSGSIYGSMKESNLYKEDIAAYVRDAHYLAQNKRCRDCCEIFYNARENMKYLSRDDINQELRNLGENNLDDFVKKYFINDEKKYGEKILVLFKVNPQ